MPSVVYEFGPFRLDPSERLLLRDGVPAPLAPKVIEILLLLVERRGGVVTKGELIARLWPDTFVQESNLTQHIFMLRKALDDGGPSYVETVPRRGYRFAREVRPVAGAAAGPIHEPAEQLLVSNRTRISVVTEETEVSAPPLPAASPRVRPVTLVVAGAAVVALVAGGAMLNRSTSRPKATAAPAVPAGAPRLERLTTDSRSYEPAISPDGRFVAYQVADAGHQTVWLRNIATGSAVQILPPLAGGYYSLNFSGDGNELLYKTFRGKSDNGTVLRVPLFGGAPRQVATNVWSDFSLSPDGREIAFLRANGALEHQLVTAGLEGGERVVATLGDEQHWLEVANTSPSWSPDRQRLAVCGGWREPGRGWTFGIFEVPAAGGAVRRVPSPAWNRISQVAWLGDGSGLVVVGRSQQRDPYQVWLLDYPSGQARRLTNDLHDYNKLRVSPDSKVIAIEQQIAFHHLWVVNADGTAPARQITHGARSLDGYYGLSWTPDGRLLFASSRTGESELFTAKPDGSELRQLTRDSTEWNTNGRMTGDGRYIVFSSGRGGEANVWRMDFDGSNPMRLTQGKSEFSPTLSPDGRWVYYVNAHVAPSRIERVPIDGGAASVVFADAAAEVPAVSPDGRWLAFSYYSEPTGWRAAVIPAAGGPPRLFDWHGVRGFVRWAPDSTALMFMKQEGNVSNVWRQPLDGGEPRQVTTFEEQFIWNFAPSPDGRQLALSCGSSVSDIVLLRAFR